MRLFVQSGSRSPYSTGAGRAWILLFNTWNDYSYRTLFELYLEEHRTFSKYGSVKILRLGQREGQLPLQDGEVEGGQLPDDYASIGTDLDYYARIPTLPDAEGREILSSLRDISVDEVHRAKFADEPGLRVSLHRDRQDRERFYEDAVDTFTGGGNRPEEHSFSFNFTPAGSGEPIAFAFKPGSVAAGRLTNVSGPSHRLIAIVGNNGVGKTSLLARLARVAYAPPSEREAVADDGVIEGSAAFPSVVAISYSAFDSFDPPNLKGDSKDEVASQLREGTGRYAYCGMRDLALSISEPTAPKRLLSLDEMEAVFVDRIEKIRSLDRMQLLARALYPVLTEDSFARHLSPDELDPEQDINSRSLLLLNKFLGESVAGAFRPLSSGHKIVLHLIASLTATLRRRGLALIDEPETHLHPPLLAALMNGIRRVLAGQHAYAIVATHSPIIAQETLARQVLIMEPDGTVRSPDIETFGENTGTLTREIFGLYTGATDFRRVLDGLAKHFKTLEEIESFLGTELSPPALAHVLAALKRAAS